MKDNAIILAAGSGNRMQSDIKKQFLQLKDKPLLYYSLKAFEDSGIEEVVVVAPKEDIDYCKNEIVERYGFNKVKTVTEGGAERYHSVCNGLRAMSPCENVLIHDAARPLVTVMLIEEIRKALEENKAVISAVPVKDTIKSADNAAFVTGTPDRRTLWQIQTPQAFRYSLIRDAYEYIIREGFTDITDDGMAVERYTHGNEPVLLLEGTYENIKITTPEDLLIAGLFLEKREKNDVDTKYN